MSYELPLFPLNTVLFPGMPLTLHIFEERYKEMVQHCLQTQGPFGVVLIREGLEAGGPLAEPHPIGCTAEISQVQQLSDGRLNILATGKERFRIVSLHHRHTYLSGIVENFPLEGVETESLAAGQRLRPRLREYLSLLSQASESQLESEELPDNPQTLAYLAATLLQVPNTEKQQLLSTAEAQEFLGDVTTLYQREIPLLRLMLQQAPLQPALKPFSLN